MTALRWTTAGESHGPGLVGILEGFPAGVTLDLDAVNAELQRRQGGYGRGGRMKIESDSIELLSGTKGGITIGSPISFQIVNRDHTIDSLPTPTNPRPGHADLAGCQKFTHTDPRAILERASARETAARVALGAIARQLLGAFDVEIFAHVVELGGVAVDDDAVREAWAMPAAERHGVRGASEFACLDPTAEKPLRQRVDDARDDRDSLGGVFEVRVTGLPPGLGSYASGRERLTSRLGAALFSIPAMKGVEFGLGFAGARLPGSQVHDPIVALSGPSHGQYGRFGRSSNRAGGLEGGMSTGEPLVIRTAMKPIPSLKRGLPSVDFVSGEVVQATYQRSDVTSVPAASVVGEAVVALELSAAFLEKFGGDALEHIKDSFEAWRGRVREL